MHVGQARGAADHEAAFDALVNQGGVRLAELDPADPMLRPAGPKQALDALPQRFSTRCWAATSLTVYDVRRLHASSFDTAATRNSWPLPRHAPSSNSRRVPIPACASRSRSACRSSLDDLGPGVMLQIRRRRARGLRGPRDSRRGLAAHVPEGSILGPRERRATRARLPPLRASRRGRATRHHRLCSSSASVSTSAAQCDARREAESGADVRQTGRGAGRRVSRIVSTRARRSIMVSSGLPGPHEEIAARPSPSASAATIREAWDRGEFALLCCRRDCRDARHGSDEEDRAAEPRARGEQIERVGWLHLRAHVRRWWLGKLNKAGRFVTYESLAAEPGRDAKRLKGAQRKKKLATAKRYGDTAKATATYARCRRPSRGLRTHRRYTPPYTPPRVRRRRGAADPHRSE